MKKDKVKKVVKHLRGDIKTFHDEAAEDKKLIKALKAKRKVKKEVKKASPRKKKRMHEAKESPGHEKFEQVIREYESGKLHSGSKKGPKVKKLSQALAIGYSEDRKADGTAKKSKRRRKK